MPITHVPWLLFSCACRVRGWWCQCQGLLHRSCLLVFIRVSFTVRNKLEVDSVLPISVLRHLLMLMGFINIYTWASATAELLTYYPRCFFVLSFTLFHLLAVPVPLLRAHLFGEGDKLFYSFHFLLVHTVFHSCLDPLPVLESVNSPRKFVFFYQKMVLNTQTWMCSRF